MADGDMLTRTEARGCGARLVREGFALFGDRLGSFSVDVSHVWCKSEDSGKPGRGEWTYMSKKLQDELGLRMRCPCLPSRYKF
jgi:hypothetical protein